MVQQIRKHGASDHLPGGPDAIPWLGDYPYGSGEGNQGIHMIGLLADMPAPSLGTQTGADGAVASSSTAFSAASGRFTAANTGGTLQVIDTGASPPVVYSFTVTYVDATHLTLGSGWAGTGTSSLSWVLSGQGPSNAGLMYFATDGSGGGGIQFDTNNVGDWLDITATGMDGSGYGMSFTTTTKGMQFNSATQFFFGGEYLTGHFTSTTNQNSLTFSDNLNFSMVGPGVLFEIGKTGELAFFGVATTGQQVSGGTTAGVIAGLVALGLFSS